MAQKTYSAEELQEFEERLDNERLTDTRERRFYLACLTRDLETIIELKNQIDITAHNDLAVRFAASSGYLDVVKYLHEQGADICAGNNDALRCSAENGHLNIVKYLHEHGADIRLDNDYAFRAATENGHLDVVKYLHEHSVDICADNNDYAFRLAAHNGHLNVVKYLHEQGADIRTANDYALYWALLNGHVLVVRYILNVVQDIEIIEKLNLSNWKDEHFKQFFSLRFMMQNPFIAQRVWDIVPQDQKTPAVIQHYQKNMTVVLLRNPLQQQLAVG